MLRFLRLTTLIVAYVAAAWTASVHAETRTTERGGQCVAYARAQMQNLGIAASNMPGLGNCGTDSLGRETCGAWKIYDLWDMGFGKGSLPRANSLLVLNVFPGGNAGHVAVVRSVTKAADGTYSLVADESNWHVDELISRNVSYTFNPTTMTVQREGGTAKPVRGFVYSSLAQDTALTFHGAGSLINPTSLQTKVCDSFGGWGCYRDEVRLHADGSTPLGVFQVGRDASYCTQVNLQLVATAGASMPVQNVKVRLGPWNNRSVDVEYTISLPATIPLLNRAWNLVAVQFPSPISQQAKLLATCAGSGGGLYPTASASRAPANSRGIDLANGYSWTGNGSAISRSGGSVQSPFGSTQDWAKMHSFSGNGTGGTFFQWQKSVACPRVVLSARTDSGHYRIRIRAWDSAPSTAFALEGVYLSASSSWSPSVSLIPVDNYYLIYIYPQPASASAATHDLELKCQ